VRFRIAFAVILCLPAAAAAQKAKKNADQGLQRAPARNYGYVNLMAKPV